MLSPMRLSSKSSNLGVVLGTFALTLGRHHLTACIHIFPEAIILSGAMSSVRTTRAWYHSPKCAPTLSNLRT